MDHRSARNRAARDERGITLVEYGIIVALIGAAIVGSVAFLGYRSQGGYNSAASALPPAAGATTSAPPGGGGGGGGGGAAPTPTKAAFSGGPASSTYSYNASSADTYNLYTSPNPDIPSSVDFGDDTCTSGNGCSRYTFNPSTGVFSFAGGSNSWGSRNATVSIPWTVDETPTMLGGSGTLVITFT